MTGRQRSSRAESIADDRRCRCLTAHTAAAAAAAVQLKLSSLILPFVRGPPPNQTGYW